MPVRASALYALQLLIPKVSAFPTNGHLGDATRSANRPLERRKWEVRYICAVYTMCRLCSIILLRCINRPDAGNVSCARDEFLPSWISRINCYLKFQVIVAGVEMDAFPVGVGEKLKFYVYRLIDPRNGETFYIGKGKNDRIFQHAKATKSADLTIDVDTNFDFVARVLMLSTLSIVTASKILRRHMRSKPRLSTPLQGFRTSRVAITAPIAVQCMLYKLQGNTLFLNLLYEMTN